MEPQEIRAIAERTVVVRAPKQPLMTFGVTKVTYHLVTEPALAEADRPADEAVIRTGLVTANRPQLVTPNYLLNLFQGFENGESFARYLMETQGPSAPGLLYAYGQELQETNLVSDPPDVVAARLAERLDREDQVHAAVIRGVAPYWDVSLMKFIHDLTVGSLGQTIGDLGRRGLLGVENGVPRAARAQIEDMFAAVAAGELDPAQLQHELARWGLWEEYQDRFDHSRSKSRRRNPMLTMSAPKLRETTKRVFEAAGAPTDIASQMAEILVESNLAGHDSHGIIRIPAYVRAIKEGNLVPDARPAVIEEAAGSALVDGKYGFGHIAAAFATDVAARKAKENKAAVVSIVRCNHIGRLGEWGSRAAAQGVIALVTVGGSGGPGIAAPFGGAARAMSTNPISIGIPGGEKEDMLVDFATTGIAEGKVQVARAKGAQLPPGVLQDKEGKPSTNPEDLYAGGMLLPFGGHKGYGLAMVVELLGAALTPGQRYNRNGQSGGAVIIAIDAATFRPLPEFEAAADATLGRIKAIPPAAGFSEVLLPGEPEQRSKAERQENGIPVAEATWNAIVETGKSLGITIE